MTNSIFKKFTFTISSLIIITFTFTSCGSSKKVNTSKKTNTTVNNRNPSSRPIVSVKPIEGNRENNSQNSNKTSINETLEATSSIKVTPQNVQDYILTFKITAQNNMRQHGIPASIIMSQGILESGIGKGKLASDANNHFGIKCHKEWQGDVIYHDDDSAGECFRKYKDASESYRDHALFLTSRNRYNALFQLAKDDYKGWANGLKNAGYATDSKYPDKLIGLIERYELFLLDQEVLGITNQTKPTTTENTNSTPTKPTGINNKPMTSNKSDIFTNDINFHIVEAGQTLYSISRLYQLNTDDLMKLNQLETTSLSVGQKLIVKKSATSNETNQAIDENKTHLVSAGDTLFNISKRYGLTVDQLKLLNNLSDNNISLGQVLKIK